MSGKQRQQSRRQQPLATRLVKQQRRELCEPATQASRLPHRGQQFRMSATSEHGLRSRQREPLRLQQRALERVPQRQRRKKPEQTWADVHHQQQSGERQQQHRVHRPQRQILQMQVQPLLPAQL